MDRVTVYIDGFNFYYSLRRLKAIDSDWLKFYWIDFVKLFEQFLGQNQVLQKVVYFSAVHLNVQKANRQRMLFNTNKAVNGNRFELINGKFFKKNVVCPFCNAAISKPEEKRTDVNISVKLLGDCARNMTDVILLVTADSDLVPPLDYIKRYHPDKKIKIYFPPSAYSSDLHHFMKSNKGKVVLLKDNKQRFNNAVMPYIITKNGITYAIPQKWKI